MISRRTLRQLPRRNGPASSMSVRGQCGHGIDTFGTSVVLQYNGRSYCDAETILPSANKNGREHLQQTVVGEYLFDHLVDAEYGSGARLARASACWIRRSTSSG